MRVRFAIEEVFVLRKRGVVLAAGRLLEGTIAGKMTLEDEKSGGAVRIVGVELLPPPPQNPDRLTLIIDPASAARPASGMVLVSPA